VSFEPIPLEYFAKLKREMGPRLASIRAAIRELAKQDPQARSIELFAEELDGKWSAEGMASLGFSTTPRFAVYGLGASVVARLEVDPQAVFGTLDRIARRAGTSLPPAQRRGDWRLWSVPRAGGRVVIALGDGTLVVAAGPVRAIDDALPVILGEQQPAASMAGLDQAAFRLWSALTPPLPEPFGQITGAVFASESLVSLAAASRGGGMPPDLDAFMMVTALDPKAIARAVLDRAPKLRRLGVVLDGKLHKLDLPLPFEVHAGASARAGVLGAGAYGRRSAEQALGAAAGAAAPLFAMIIDVKQVIAARPEGFPDLSADLPNDSDQLARRIGQLIAMFMIVARWEFTVDASAHGLVLRFAENRK